MDAIAKAMGVKWDELLGAVHGYHYVLRPSAKQLLLNLGYSAIIL